MWQMGELTRWSTRLRVFFTRGFGVHLVGRWPARPHRRTPAKGSTEGGNRAPDVGSVPSTGSGVLAILLEQGVGQQHQLAHDARFARPSAACHGGAVHVTCGRGPDCGCSRSPRPCSASVAASTARRGLKLRPLQVPDSGVTGTRAAKLAAALASRRPNSGISASSPLAVIPATPVSRSAPWLDVTAPRRRRSAGPPRHPRALSAGRSASSGTGIAVLGAHGAHAAYGSARQCGP